MDHRHNYEMKNYTQNRNIDQQNRIDSPEENPCTYGHFIYDKSGRNIQWNKDHLINKRHWENWTSYMWKNEIRTHPNNIQKINTKRIKDPNVRLDTIKLLEKNIGRTLSDIYCSNIFFIPLPQFSSISQSCPTLCDPMDCSMSGFPVHIQLPELTQTHVHRVRDAIQPSDPVIPFSSCLQSFPTSVCFPISQLFASGGQSIGVSASASVLPINIQDWFTLGWTGWIWALWD